MPIQGGGSAVKELTSLISNFSKPIFSSTQFWILCISRAPDIITVSSNKNTSKKAFCASNIAILPGQKCMCKQIKTAISDLLLLSLIYGNMSIQPHIENKIIFCFIPVCHFGRGGGWRKKWQSVTRERGGFKKCHFTSDVLFE